MSEFGFRSLPSLATIAAYAWQLNDCWPVASWASIDYYGRWKAAHYASCRFFAPLLLSIEDDGDRLALFVTSEPIKPWAGQLRWSLETLEGERLEGGAVEVEVGRKARAHHLPLA